MEYSIRRLAQLAGVSARTLRYYDEIGLLRPARMSNGYRIYGEDQVNTLQQILFFRELGFPLGEIRTILTDPAFDRTAALRRHLAALRQRRRQLDALIHTVRKSIRSAERSVPMQDKEKFEGFKQRLLEENEERYGQEIRAKYGDDVVEASYDKLRGMTPARHAASQQLEQRVFALLDEAFETGDPAGEAAQRLAATHREWLEFFWPQYTPQAHADLAQMYVDDSRFGEYYDRGRPGKTEFLRDAVVLYTQRA